MVTNNYTPYSGGVVSSINATVQALQQQGHQVTLVTLDFLGAGHTDPAWVKRLNCPIKFRYKQNHMAVAWRAKKQLKKIIADLSPDVVHVHHPFLLGRIAARIAKSQDVPTVFTYHTMYEAYAHYISLPQVITKRIITKRVLSFCRFVTGIIAPSTSIKKYLLAKGIQTPIKVIPSSVQDIFFSSVHAERPIEKGSLRLLSVGRMVQEKNIEALLHVAVRLVAQEVPFTFTLVGYGAHYESLRAYAYEKLKLSPEQVIFVHQPPKDVIMRLYVESDIFLFSSHTDTQGIVLAEAMACGLPVIALDGPGQRDIIVQGENGYIVTDEDKMFECIVQLSTEPSTIARLSHHAYLTAQRYRPEVLVQHVLDFYRQAGQ
jgi:glycosyltransferase involved in cell wall biosynthesis